MRPTTSRTLLASFGIAALGLAALASVASKAQPQTPQAANVATWVQATPNRAPVSCPLAAAAGTADAPYFGFANLPQSCLLDGPYAWNGKSWFVQRIKGIKDSSGKLIDVIRVCTAAAVDPSRTSHFSGPCRTVNGAGPKGCEVCVADGVAQ
jgi:hypothetical protein